MDLEFSGQIFEKKAQISSFIRIRPVETELFHADRQTKRDRRTDMTKLTVAFRNFENVPKKKQKAHVLPNTKYCWATLSTSFLLSESLYNYSFSLEYEKYIHIGGPLKLLHYRLLERQGGRLTATGLDILCVFRNM